MSTLTLVRHGQASPFQKVSDKLSDTGAEQMRALARYWRDHGITFDEVMTGTMVRHHESEAVVAKEIAGWPTAQASVAWNEYDATGVLTNFVPALASRDERFSSLVDDFDKARGGPEQNRYFQRMFEVAMRLWLEEAFVLESVEPFRVFRERVIAALTAATAPAASRRVVVFTSGGPIGLILQHVLKAPVTTFLEVNWRVRNCSVTEFVFGAGRISLDSFNSVAHLPAPIQTFR